MLSWVCVWVGGGHNCDAMALSGRATFGESRFLHLHGVWFTRWFSKFKSHLLNDPLPRVFHIFMRSVSG